MMDPMELFNDRRPAPEPDSRPVEVPEVEHGTEVDPRMTEEALINSIRVPSANPGPGAMVMGRMRDRDLCRHCDMPLISHGSGTFEHHAPEAMTGGQRAPGVHSDVDNGRARSTQPSGIMPTARYES